MMEKLKDSKNRSTIVSILYVLAIIAFIFGVLISIFYGVILHSRLLQEYGYIPSWYVLFITILQMTRNHFIFAVIFFAVGKILEIRESKNNVKICGKAYFKQDHSIEFVDFAQNDDKEAQDKNSDGFRDNEMNSAEECEHA